jgi:hypothetical protein
MFEGYELIGGILFLSFIAAGVHPISIFKYLIPSNN